MDPFNLNWNDIANEIREELNRDPKASEIQQAFLQKCWNMTDIIEKEDKENNE